MKRKYLYVGTYFVDLEKFWWVVGVTERGRMCIQFYYLYLTDRFVAEVVKKSTLFAPIYIQMNLEAPFIWD